MVAIGEDLGLERQERAARVHEVEARQPVLACDLLGAEVLFHRQRVVGATLDGRVVGDEDALAALDHPDAGDDARRGRVSVVQLPGGEGVQLEERAPGIDESVDPLPRCELPPRAVPLDCLLAAPSGNERGTLAKLGHERLHRRAAALERLVAADVGREHGHGRGAYLARVTTLACTRRARTTRGGLRAGAR